MKEKKLYMIGNAHIDPVWLWQWYEGFQEVKATFRSALDRMNEYEDFKFCASSSIFYKWIEKNCPEMFEEIKKRVSEGRWELVGGWIVEPDCNIPSGESFVRHGLYAQRYFKDRFDKIAKVGFNIDSFGHAGTLPQILKKSGIDFYVFLRPQPHEKHLPNNIFYWQSNDGSRVLTARIPYEYCSWGKELTNHIERCAMEIKPPYKEMICFYGVGNHGGGPTKQNIESIHQLNENQDLIELIISTPTEFFKAILNNEYPVVIDDLQHHASGCYAAHSNIKMMNRKAENMLLFAEKFSTIADVLELQRYEKEQFQCAWENLLFNQFHDILAGTSLEESYEDAIEMIGETMSIAKRNLNFAIQAISWQVDIEYKENSKPIVVFNPHSWDSVSNIELEFGNINPNDLLVDENNNIVPFQIITSHATSGGRNRLSFVANLPSLGYRTFNLIQNSDNNTELQKMNASHNFMENERFKLEIDENTGFIKTLYDKKEQFEIFQDLAAVLKIVDDNSDTWAHGVLKFDKFIGEFTKKSIKLIEHGPVKSIIRVESIYNNSLVIQDFTMYKDINRIDVDVVVDWREKQKMLKILFPVNLIFVTATHEVPYGIIERETNGEEEPIQSWVDMTGIIKGKNTVYGVSIINNGKYSLSIDNKTIGLTVLRSPVYAHHDPMKLEEGKFYSYIDNGIQKFRYSILPHKDKFSSANVAKHAYEVNQKPFALVETFHKGKLPKKMSFARVDKENVIISCLKLSEDDNDIILRCYEAYNKQTLASIELPILDRKIIAEFKPNEIKTFKIPRDSSKQIIEVNLLEYDL